MVDEDEDERSGSGEASDEAESAALRNAHACGAIIWNGEVKPAKWWAEVLGKTGA